MPDVVSVILRALSFALLFQAAGVAIFIAISGRQLAGSRVPVRRVGQAAAAAAIVLVAAHYALEAARMAGEMSGMWDPTLQGMAWHSPARAALICRLLGLALIAAGLKGSSIRRTFLAVGGAVLAILAFTLTGHTSVNAHRGVLAGLLLIHLLVVAFWFGALWPLSIVSLRETPARAFDLVERFTAVATWLVPVILVVGLAMAALLLPSLSALSEPMAARPRPGPGICAKWAMVSPVGGSRVCPDRGGIHDHSGNDVFLLAGGVTLRRRSDRQLSEQCCCCRNRGRRGREEWRWPDRR
jgi:putative copper export protein